MGNGRGQVESDDLCCIFWQNKKEFKARSKMCHSEPKKKPTQQ